MVVLADSWALSECIDFLDAKMKAAQDRRVEEASLARQDGESFNEDTVLVAMTVSEAERLRKSLASTKDAMITKVFEKDDLLTHSAQATSEAFIRFLRELQQRSDQIASCIEQNSTHLALLGVKDLPSLVEKPFEEFNQRLQKLTESTDKVFVVTAVCESTIMQPSGFNSFVEVPQIGWRSRIIIASDPQEACEKAHALFVATESNAKFSAFGFLEINPYTRAEAASVVFEEVNALL